MTAEENSGGALIGDRDLVEDAVKILLREGPTGWAHLHADFEPSAQPPVAAAYIATADVGPQPAAVPPDAVALLAEHQRRAAVAGAPWRHLVIDCYADGRLSVRTDPMAAAAAGPRRPRRWPQRVLAAITLACLAAAAVVFAVGWRWAAPPRLTVLGVPPPPRAQKAFAVVNQWYDAENKRDVTRMRELACAHPATAVTDWINTIAFYGPDQALIYPDAVTEFHDEGTTVVVKVAVRIHPIDERSMREVEEAQENGGFLHEIVTLAGEGDDLKVCDVALPPK